MQRRQILAVLGAGGLATLAYRAFGGGGGMVARGLKWPRGLTPAVTPAGDHYTVSKNFLFSDPRLDGEAWRLDVHGRVARSLSLSLDEIRNLPAVEQYATLACIGNSVPARAIGTALWRGVPLATILERTGSAEIASPPTSGGIDVVFTAADNYTDSITLERALHAGTILAYEMNDAPLPAAHGAPLRAIVPGIYGMKNVKWIEAIEIVAGDYRGYWQQRGWSDPAPYQTLARIDEPRNGDALDRGAPCQICGIAFAGDRGVSRVEVLIDGEPRPAALLPALSPHTWVLWTLDWQWPAGGRHAISARVVDGDGVPQIMERRSSFPHGATGLHTIEVNVA